MALLSQPASLMPMVRPFARDVSRTNERLGGIADEHKEIDIGKD